MGLGGIAAILLFALSSQAMGLTRDVKIINCANNDASRTIEIYALSKRSDSGLTQLKFNIYDKPAAPPAPPTRTIIMTGKESNTDGNWVTYLEILSGPQQFYFEMNMIGKKSNLFDGVLYFDMPLPEDIESVKQKPNTRCTVINRRVLRNILNTNYEESPNPSTTPRPRQG